MKFIKNFINKKTIVGINSIKNNKSRLPLKSQILNYQFRINKQLVDLNSVLDTFYTEKNTSLDVILRKTLNNLRVSLLEYAVLLEEVLIARGVIATNAIGQRGLYDIVNLAKSRLHFYGGSRALEASQFLAKAQNMYLSDIDDKLAVKCVKAIYLEYENLELFIKKN